MKHHCFFSITIENRFLMSVKCLVALEKAFFSARELLAATITGMNSVNAWLLELEHYHQV